MPLEVAKLSRRYGNVWALRDVTFAAAAGRVFGVCGGSGSGKSTLLQAIAGQGKTSGGSITLDEQDLTRVPAKQRGISFFSGERAVSLLGMLGVGAHKGSSGRAQFDAFESEIATAGKVLLLDNPFSQMDGGLRQECLARVRRAARGRDRIVIFATSDFDQIASVADDAAILTRGEISQIGTPQEIYENPDTIDAATISGENNLVEARRLTSTDADLPEFHTIDGGHRIFAQRTAKSRLGAINQNMTLAIRPEQISMSPGSSSPESNLFRAVVAAIKFRGPTSLIEFDSAGLRLETRVFKTAGVSVGDEYMLGLPPHRILILKD